MASVAKKARMLELRYDKLVDVAGDLAAQYYRLRLISTTRPEERATYRRISQLEGKFRKITTDINRVRKL